MEQLFASSPAPTATRRIRPLGSAEQFRRAVVKGVREERERQRIPVDELVRRGAFQRGTLLRYLFTDRDLPINALYRIAVGLGIEPAGIVARASLLLSEGATGRE